MGKSQNYPIPQPQPRGPRKDGKVITEHLPKDWEKQRDYIAASRVIGASTPRILFRHLLPNSVAIIITLVPFSVSSLVLSLTSLDYLGFGLPAKYATWGQLLRDGLDNLAAPWLVTSAFIVLVGLLILITFIGEAVREAFDPKKFSYYR